MLDLAVHPEPAIDGIIVRLSGAATFEESGRLQELLAPLAEACPRGVVLDFSKLEIITSLCIGVLVAFRKGVIAGPPDEHQPGRVVIASASAGINRSLKFTRLDDLFELFDDVSSAVAALRT